MWRSGRGNALRPEDAEKSARPEGSEEWCLRESRDPGKARNETVRPGDLEEDEESGAVGSCDFRQNGNRSSRRSLQETRSSSARMEIRKKKAMALGTPVRRCGPSAPKPHFPSLTTVSTFKSAGNSYPPHRVEATVESKKNGGAVDYPEHLGRRILHFVFLGEAMLLVDVKWVDTCI
ncbi:UNVERIFIED_CONTAM: hypothetical protein PYX00_007217 [Menopon gallinae]|uniref:Uncharacterized protein n=1 Tax=Menopon gallinae TaxID=328185 RepID=A0AAW2HI07_9NEOP